jgi:hypothetical protein
MSGSRSVFDSGPRTDRTPARHNEDIYSFLDRSALPFFQEVRDLIQEWVLHVPAGHRAQLVGSFRSRAPDKFESALWELYLHEAYTQSGHAIAIHPEITGTSTRPDFLVESATTRFYLEAVRVGRKEEEIAEERRLNDVHAVLNTLPADRFMIDVTTYNVGPRPLATRKLRQQLITWLAGCDPVRVAQEAASFAGFAGLPRSTWRQDGWHLEFHAFPLRAEGASRGKGLVGMLGPGEAHVVDNVSGILRVLHGKSSKYGSLDAPLVIAVLSNTMIPTKDYEVEQALYGVSSRRPNAAALEPGDLFCDGHWLSRGGWRRGHAPQVIAMQGLTPWNVTAARPRLWATLEPGVALPEQPMWLARVDVTGAEARVGLATQLTDLFGLPADWLDRDPEWGSF